MPQLRDITFIWPLMLLLLLSVPLLIWWYRRIDTRQRVTALRYARLASATSMTGSATAPSMPVRSGWSRHVPALLLLLAIVALLVAVARPQGMVVLPTRTDAIILALDVSGSMRANDVKPDRLTAAQNAAKTFIEDQPDKVRVGVVTMAATAAMVQSPTNKREDVIDAIERVKLQNGTALGSGIVIALTTLLPEPAIDVDKLITGRPSFGLTPEQRAAIERFKPVAPGSNGSAAIILLTDGESNTGPDLLTAAKLAAERGVRIYTVGIGTKQGATLSVDGWSMRVRLDEEALKKVADMTRAEYFRAANAADLKKIYKQLAARMTAGRGRTMELTAFMAALGMGLALIAVGYSMLRFNRVL
jgi:Ca-activated chloride channel homolog